MAIVNKQTGDPYENLVNAVIAQAAEDYRAVLKKIKAHPKNKDAINEALRIERFFRSGWYQTLTSVDGECLIRRLQAEFTDFNRRWLMNRKQQEAKKYLSQAFGLNQRIESKLNQIEELHNLAAKVTAAYSDMPKSPNRDGSRMEDTVCRIIDLESEINQDMLWLVELKKGIVRRIKAVENTELQMVLELRYLSYMRWEEIAIELGYGIDNVFRLHRKALAEIEIPETIQ